MGFVVPRPGGGEPARSYLPRGPPKQTLQQCLKCTLSACRSLKALETQSEGFVIPQLGREQQNEPAPPIDLFKRGTTAAENVVCLPKRPNCLRIGTVESKGNC